MAGVAFRVSSSLALLVLCAVVSGCQPEEKIASFETKSARPPRQPVDSTGLEAKLDHTLVAIIPQGEKAWFFKLPAAAGPAERQRKAMLDFLGSVKLGESADMTPTWKLPEGWEEKGASMMRVATLVVPDEEGPLEIAVSALPYRGDWDNFLLMNVNRWLGQLQQLGLDAESVGQLAKPIDIQGGKATFVEMRGIRQQKRPGPPHAAQSIFAPATSEPPAAPMSDALTYETPEGWAPGRLSPVREAAFQIVEGEAKAEVTVILFPEDAGRQISDVEANVLRWAGQAGLAEQSPAEVMKLVKPIAVGGVEGSYVELLGPERSMLAAMLVRDGKVWFFKIFGTDALVQANSAKFRAFLDSVKFR